MNENEDYSLSQNGKNDCVFYESIVRYYQFISQILLLFKEQIIYF